MINTNVKKLFLMLCLIPPISFASVLTGQYQCHGYDPIEKTKYTGQGTLLPNGEAYTMTWTYDDGTKFHGIGILEKDILSFGIVQDKTKAKQEASGFGIQQYRVKGTKLEGRWGLIGFKKLGWEICQKSQ